MDDSVKPFAPSSIGSGFMRETDVVIAGGGLAGSTAAAMLARKGFKVLLVDPHVVYPPDLRCEKLDKSQEKILRLIGLADLILPAGTLYREIWIARFGRVVEKRPEVQYGILYETLVNAVRATIPIDATFVSGKVTAITNSPDRQTVNLSTGEKISARLVIIANGLNTGLRHALGMVRKDVSKCHSITIAFDVKPLERDSFDFQALTYYPERTTDRLAYITLFPVGQAMRVNLMVYRDTTDPWLREMRQQPALAMQSILPGLSKLIGPTEVVGPVRIRPADLYVTQGYLQPGVVLVGDAFATSCPAAGTGTNKVYTDVERLCNFHMPQWMASKGMGVEKIVTFYEDPIKVDCDRSSIDKAFRLRSLSIDKGLAWGAHRWSSFYGHLAIGAARQVLAWAK